MQRTTEIVEICVTEQKQSRDKHTGSMLMKEERRHIEAPEKLVVSDAELQFEAQSRSTTGGGPCTRASGN